MQRTFEGNAKNFLRYSSIMSNAHYDMAEIYRRRHRAFGFAVVVATSLVGTTIFASLAKTAPPEWGTWIKVGTGFLSVLATVLAALQTFLGFSELQTQHKRGGDGYSEVRRDIELLLMNHPNIEGAPNEVAASAMEAIKKKLDDFDRASPTIPDEIYNAASAKTPQSE